MATTGWDRGLFMLETELCAGSGNEATLDNGEKSTGLRKEVTRLSSMPQIGQQSGACPMTGAFADPIRETCLAPSPGNAFAVLAETLSQSPVEIVHANSLEKAKLASLATKHAMPRDQSTDNG
ncbi:hypothetical protein PCH_Pc13g00110 [Penicillium rubens Wisconsin 54-1255]|uniref:Uncharacterized protein n=1 Tax=Penicillium rubens (strain ATCC 28089 / DSM 1075 / NRRL 1951 / Wisconsin 54-1255) TaxID=500485 RepID=B6H5G0_PENRW|nr:hypothetical protein PCH_Pc13g00110 [Penicillium rubens Wisconsin 54-1255]